MPTKDQNQTYDVTVTNTVSGTEWKIGDEVEAAFGMKTFDAAGGAGGTEEWDSTYTITS